MWTRRAGSGIVTYGTDTLCGEQAFGVDWFNVGYFASNVNKLNTFQLILVNRPDTGAGNFDIEFNYNSIEWETGDASGGVNGLGGQSAAVGYSNGTGTPGTFFELPGSHIPGSFINGGPDQLISQEILSSTPGQLNFLVREGQVLQDAAAHRSHRQQRRLRLDPGVLIRSAGSRTTRPPACNTAT